MGFHIILFGLDQMITSPTRITPHSRTLIDNIYTSDTGIVSNILVPATEISDHFSVCCALSVKTVKPLLNVHFLIVPAEFMSLVFTSMPGGSYRRRLGSLLLYLCYVFRALIISLVC